MKAQPMDWPEERQKRAEDLINVELSQNMVQKFEQDGLFVMVVYVWNLGVVCSI